jgi:distribution and morphology protein 10
VRACICSGPATRGADAPISHAPDYLLYGRLYVPTGRLDALYSTRLATNVQALVAAISDPRADLAQATGRATATAAASPSNVMLSLQHDTGRTATEYTYSADDMMLGVRVLHNFGRLAGATAADDGSSSSSSSSSGGTGPRARRPKRIDEEDAMEGGLKGRISAGAEVYFSAKEKSVGGTCFFFSSPCSFYSVDERLA